MSSTKVDPSSTILVADSSPVTQKNTMDHLVDFHFTDIDTIKDGYELTSIVHEKKFSLILIDHHLNKSNSLNAIAEIRKQSENTDTPILFTFNNNIDEEEKRDLIHDIKSLKVSAILSKPYTKDDLRNAVEKSLDQFIITASEEKSRSKKSLAATETAIGLANSIRESGEFEQSEKIYIEAMLSIFHGLAEVYLAGGKTDAFKTVLREIGQIDPQAMEKFKTRTKNFVERGNEHLNIKRHRLAKFEFEAAIYLDEKNIPAHLGMGESLLGLNEKDSAIQHFKQVLEFKPEIESRISYKKIGTISFRLKEYDISVRAFEIASSFIQTDPELFYLQSLVFVAQWKFEEALACINKALNLKPSFKEAEKAKDKILAWAKAHQEKEIQSIPAT